MSKSNSNSRFPQLGLVTSFTNEDKGYGAYVHFHAWPVVIGMTLSESQQLASDADRKPIAPDRIRNVSDEAVRGLFLNNLRVSAQGCSTDTERRLYAFDICYHDVFSVDLRTAKRMAKTLQTIEGRMDKLAEKVGRPSTFGNYLAHVAQAIGANRIVSKQRNGRRGSMYAETDYRIETIGDGVYTVNNAITMWQRDGAEAIAS